MNISILNLAAADLREARLYLLITPCPQCDRCALTPLAERIRADGPRLDIPCRCLHCQGQTDCRFALDHPIAQPFDPDKYVELASLDEVCPPHACKQCSKLIDLAGWLNLTHLLSAQVQAHTLPPARRALLLLIGDCLREGLKFYDPDNELPAPQAFFSNASRRQYQDHPEVFLRRRWLEQLSSLPVRIG